MKQLFIVAVIFFAASVRSWAGEGKNIVPSILRSAIVYRTGAELTHTAKVTLTQGNNDLVIEGVSNRVDVNSIQVGTDGNVTILSVEFSTDHLRPVQKSNLILKLDDSLGIVNKELEAVQVVLKTNQELLDLLKANKEIRGTQTGLSVTELTKMMDYYRMKTLELQKEISQYKEKESRLLDAILKITRQINEEEKKNTKTVGKLQLQLFCPVAGTYNFTVSYITPLASWNPAYDLRVENISKPVKIGYKAKLVQTSGIDWKNVKLTLATSVPNQNNNAPVLNSWFLAYQNPTNNLDKLLSGKLAGVDAKAKHSMSEVVVVRGYGIAKSARDGAAEEINNEPVYVVNGSIIDKSEFKKIDSRAIKSMSVLKDEEATSLYGSRANAGAVVVTLKDNLGDYVAINENQLNVTYEIELPYDVPTNGKEQTVALKELVVPAAYKYFTVPGIDKDAYLIAEVADWEKLNLLPGEANIIFEGTYIGTTVIDPGSTRDTLSLTLGRDKRVVVKREKLQDFSSVKFLGSNKKQSFTYEITVKNNKKEAVQLLMKDQYPISTNKDIEVEVLETSGAVNETETGLLTWTIELAPGESKKIRLGYSVKYPKDKKLNLP